MRIRTLANGDLEMTASPDCQKRIKKIIKFSGHTYASEAWFLADELQCRINGAQRYQQTAPCSIGALTSAPVITDGVNVWGYMSYQVSSFLEELAKGETVCWQKG
jgi:hypothetical protein